MKKFIALLLALVMVLSLTACSVEKAEEPAPTQAAAPAAATEITLWTYPIGGWDNQETVDALMADFEAATGIKVTVEYLTYADGDDKVNTAIEGNAAPDLIMEGPERLVANWGAKGKMVNIADLYDDTDKAEINAAKTFIKYFCDSAATADAVKAASYFAVRDTAEGADLSNIWADNAIMAEYNVLMPLLGDYYQVTTGWAEARTAWWNMLQQVGASDGSVEAIQAAVDTYVNQANGK